MATRLPDHTLGDIQGFITSGYGHLPLARYVFLEIHESRRAKAYLGQLASRVTSAAPWPTINGTKVKPTSALNVAFTAAGLEALGFPESLRCTFAPEFLEGIASRRRSAILGDTEESAPEQWEFGGASQAEIHMVVIIHGASPAALDAEYNFHAELAASSGGAVSELPIAAQTGYRPDSGHEHFGFHDGISQPAIAGIPADGVPTGEFILGYKNHYGVMTPGPVVQDAIPGRELLPILANPYLAGERLRDLGLNGSYVVYRKLQQDVAAFWQYAQREAGRIHGRVDMRHTIWIAAKMMGRWPSGAPLVMTPDRDDPRLHEHNDFLYDDDLSGLSCPFGAHVRRTNPRAVLKPYGRETSLSMTEAHRLLRRARLFGRPLFDATLLREADSDAAADRFLPRANDDSSRGIHFFCVNASISSQFEFVQQTWCNNPRFGGLTCNKDPISGDNARSGDESSHMEVPHRPVSYRTSALPRFVTVRAGAYLFMPSVTALRFLAVFRGSGTWSPR